MKKSIYESLIGQRVKNITVNSIYSIPEKGYTVRAKVFCHGCRNEADLNARAILLGKTKSCGCQSRTRPKGLNNKNTKDLTGKKFGKLTVQKFSQDNSQKRNKWVCLCDCGNTSIVSGLALKTGKTNSCGCLQERQGKEHPNWTGYEDISGSYWESLKRGAKTRSLDFSISIGFAWELFLKQNKKCALSGLTLTLGDNASLDRINSDKGYNHTNVQWVDKTINLMKMDLNEKDFIEKCKAVAQYV